MKHAILPISMLSEDEQKMRNKCIRKNREHHARKLSRLANIEDVFRRLQMFVRESV